MWVNYDNIIYDNAISLLSLNGIKNFGVGETKPIYEFFKMTLNLNETS